MRNNILEKSGALVFMAEDLTLNTESAGAPETLISDD
jgi:hypothetical protein